MILFSFGSVCVHCALCSVFSVCNRCAMMNRCFQKYHKRYAIPPNDDPTEFDKGKMCVVFYALFRSVFMYYTFFDSAKTVQRSLEDVDECQTVITFEN